MIIFENIRLALAALRSNKLRSILTMLGIIIGICSVITITTIGNSLKDTLDSVFNMLGGRVIYTSYEYIREGDVGIEKDLSKEDFITTKMLDEFEKYFNGKYLVSRTTNVGKGKLTNNNGKDINISISGASEGFIRMNSYFYKLESGRYPSIADNAGKKHSILISDLFVEQYFGKNENALGQDLSVFINGVGKIEFTIVGVFKISETYIKYMGENGKSKNEILTPAFIPYYTATSLKKPAADSDRSPEFYIADKNVNLTEATSEIEAFFDRKYKNAKYWKPFFYDMSSDMEYTTKFMNILTITLAVIAAISLLVGGIGVMNIMMVSITERTREIGIRKALGAKNGAIRIQFLVESSILCLVGGGIGVLIGIFNGFLVELIGNLLLRANPEYADLVTLNIRVSVPSIIAALLFSTIVGVFFGSYPASKAAKLDPIEALRYE